MYVYECAMMIEANTIKTKETPTTNNEYQYTTRVILYVQEKKMDKSQLDLI